jgi:hypothetical protein
MTSSTGTAGRVIRSLRIREDRPLLRAICLALLALAVPRAAAAQRELHWGKIEVSGHLDAAGDLHIIETQAIVFTGAWNGGERRFNIRPRQKLSLEGLYRGTMTGWQRLKEDSRLDDVDEYAWTDPRTLRWRSRLAAEPPFDNTVIRYELRYVLSGVLLKEADGYRLDHDFAFPDRSGAISLFVLRFTHDAAWQPLSDVRDVYTARALSPGRGFVLNLPLRFTGAGIPGTLDLTRPSEIRAAVTVILGFTALAVAWFFLREQAVGRFAPLATAQVDESWLHAHILTHPAEVVGAAWDGSIGRPEVVALIARMVGEGKLESEVDGDGRTPSMKLRLKVDRSTLDGYERTLISWLFFDSRSETTTEAVKANYREQGFNPANEIKPELEACVERLLPAGKTARAFRFESLLLFVVGVGALLLAWLIGAPAPSSVLFLGLGALVVSGTGWIAGTLFRTHLEWGRRAALACLMPALILAAGTAVFLWFYAGVGLVDLSTEALVGVAAVALALINASINALRSRQSRGAIALRKTLAAGREFFIAELSKARPALRDEWYPYALAFGLTAEMDHWSVARSRDQRSETDPDRQWSPAATTSTPPDQWSGFGGGRSGGGGASASWEAAAGGMAAGVSPPSQSRSGGSSDTDSGGSTSSSGSSGGGGGGGW